MSIDLCEGKYHWFYDGVSLTCRRNGMAWRDFTGDKATKALFDYAEELQAENVTLTEHNRYLASQMQDIRNATDCQMQQSLLDLKGENENLKNAIRKIRQLCIYNKPVYIFALIKKALGEV